MISYLEEQAKAMQAAATRDFCSSPVPDDARHLRCVCPAAGANPDASCPTHGLELSALAASFLRWELCSGSSVLSAAAKRTDVSHLPPVDYRYGW